MIQLTRLNGNPIALNSDLIKFVENAPDTVITLINGEKIIVRESSEDVIQQDCGFPAGGNGRTAGLERRRPQNSAVPAAQRIHPGRSAEASAVDKSTIGGIILALAGILAGLIIEGGKVAQILQPTAAMIVLGGTIGAVMIQFPLSVVFGAARGLIKVFLDRGQEPTALIKELVGYANRARKEGIVSLDGQLATIKDPFLKKALMLAIDGAEPEELRKMMELELDNQEEHGERLSQVFEAAGGYAPTVGIIGAVLGLIQVMQHLEDIAEVGKGIAVAFVATIYGVGMANILFLPWAGKLKIKFREEQVLREMKLEGVISILEGMNPRMLETMLTGYLPEHKQPAPAERSGRSSA